MIHVGLDDTDMPGSPGTKRLARELAAELAPRCRCHIIVRHQLLVDPRIPCTTKNSAAGMLLEADGKELPGLIDRLRAWLRHRYVIGSDPGLCVTDRVPSALTEFGQRCQREFVAQADAWRLARACGVHLEGLGGSQGGVIGALAAVGLLAGGDDGRVIQWRAWPDDLSGPQPVSTLRAREIAVRCLDTQTTIAEGVVDVGQRLRPSFRQHGVVLFAQRVAETRDGAPRWQGVRLN